MIPVIVNTDLPPQIPYGDVRLGVLVARRAYPNAPCTGHERVLVSDRVPNWPGRPPIDDWHEFTGLANLAGRRCLIWVRKSGMSREETCSVVEHEYGHWDGLDDNEPGYPVMRVADQIPIPRECRVPR